MDDPQIHVSGEIWRGNILVQDMEPEADLPLLALVGQDSWMEISFQQPATAIGVQFWGDDNDGWVRILVDGLEAWTGNTVGASDTYEDYVEIRDLSNTQHTLRIEATGKPGRDGGDRHVTVAAFGWGPLPVQSTSDEIVMFSTGANSAAQLTHFEIIRGQNPTPQHTIRTDHPWVRTGGQIWRGNFRVVNDDPESELPLLALIEKGSWVEITFEEPTTAVGVQFWGDDNDGWANILLDGTDLTKNLAWNGNTMGVSGAPFESYIEIRDLSRDKHVLRVEATGKAGRDGGDIHVTMAAFGWDPIKTTRSIREDGRVDPDDQPFKVFLPTFHK